MAKLQPVPSAPSPVGGREGSVAVVLVVALLLAIAKPWGADPGAPEPTPWTAPSPTVAAEPSREPGPALWTGMFGPFEPPPDWSIWPAGYVVSVMYVARVPRSDIPPPAPPPAASAGADPGASPVPSAGGGSPEPPSAPDADWPSTIDVGAEDHLLWLGINTPRGWTLETAVLRRLDRDGTTTPVPIRRVASPWPTHFTVIALAAEDAQADLEVWPAGTYRLELVVAPGGIARTIEIRIRTIPAPSGEETRP